VYFGGLKIIRLLYFSILERKNYKFRYSINKPTQFHCYSASVEHARTTNPGATFDTDPCKYLLSRHPGLARTKTAEVVKVGKKLLLVTKSGSAT
jgi:hypothetical protein